MKKNRCHLCGARLHGGYCQDCGFDVARTEKIRYRLNESDSIITFNGKNVSGRKIRSMKQSSENAIPETVVNPAKPVKTIRQNISQPQNVIPKAQKYQFVNQTQPVKLQKTVKVRSGKKKGIAAVIILIFVFTVLINFFTIIRNETEYYGDEVYYDSSYDYDYEETEYDPYEYVTRELSDVGETADVTLESGEYLVGVHLPEGNYTVFLGNGSGYFSVNDEENGIYLWESFGENEEYDEILVMEDVRLYQNARISVSEDLRLELSTENAQTQNMSYLENPLTEEVYIDAGNTLTAGIDFPAGVYDAEYVDEIVWASYKIPANPEWYEEKYVEHYFWIDPSDSVGAYRNVVLPEGTQITAEDADLKLIPSERISSEDYGAYYDFYVYE
ncbi:MAG: hypothetical protein J5983_03270 [Ruminococcus sp.]|nr:hypothetical protein [Ruminococcus sp.]